MNMNRLQRHLLIALIALSAPLWATSCSDDSSSSGTSETETGDTGESLPAPDAELVTAAKINAAITNARDVSDPQNAAASPIERAQLPLLDADLTNNRDLSEALVGQEVTISYDIDEDGANEDISAFIASLDMNTYLTWNDNGQCHLAWEEAETEIGWLLIGPCEPENEEAGVVVCTVTDDSNTCNICYEDPPAGQDEDCRACTVSDKEIRCQAESTGGGDTDAGGTETDTGGGGDDGPCSAECMGQSGAVCCTTCGCQGEVRCEPVCEGVYVWDCEVQCCFDYDQGECSP